MIQSATLILLIYTTQDYSSLLITIFSMIFTIVSILMSCFEYFLSSKFVRLGSSIIISFCIESHDIANMPHKQFLSDIVFCKIKLIGNVAKLLKVKHEQIERLKPTRLSNGAMFVLSLAIGVSKYDEIKQRFDQLVQNDTLLKVYMYICNHGLTSTHLHLLFVLLFVYRDCKTFITSK